MDLDLLKDHNSKVRALIESQATVLKNALGLSDSAGAALRAKRAETTPAAAPSPQTVEQLQRQCDALASNTKTIIQKLHDTRNNEKRLRTLDPAVSKPNVSPRIQMLEAKKRRLLAEIHQLQHRKPSFDPNIHNDPQLLRQLIQQDVEATLHQLDQTMAMVQKDIAEDEACLQKDKAVLAELEAIEQSIDKKLNATQQSATSPSSETRLEALLEKRQKINAINASLMRELSQFVDKYFPVSALLANRTRKRRRRLRKEKSHSSDSEEEEEEEEEEEDEEEDMNEPSVKYVEMKRILQDLMNAIVVSPDNPWIDYEERNWAPEFVSFLLVAGVAEAHPEKARLIKLQDFHL